MLAAKDACRPIADGVATFNGITVANASGRIYLAAGSTLCSLNSRRNIKHHLTVAALDTKSSILPGCDLVCSL
jgi:hypothetical protein